MLSVVFSYLGFLPGAVGYWFSTPFFVLKNRLQGGNAGFVHPELGIYQTGLHKGQPGPVYTKSGFFNPLRDSTMKVFEE